MDVCVERVHRLEPGDPQQVGEYVVLGRLGAGGIGVVFLARTQQWRLVAIKMVHRELADDPRLRQRFRAEVELARQVPAFCTAPFLDVNVDHHPPYSVTGYIDGPTLRDRVAQSGPMSQEDVYAVAAGVASALTAIHAAAVIHRDLKPGHVLLAPDGAKVIDFGIGLAFEQTGAGTAIAAGAFTAPERFGADPASLNPAADIFGWGAVVAYAATGKAGLGFASLHDITEPLRGLVRRALEPNPEDRPTARHLVDVLVGGGMAVSASYPIPGARPPVLTGPSSSDGRSTASTLPTPSPPARSPVLAGALMLLVVALVAGGLGLLHRWWDASTTVGPGTESGTSVPAVPVPFASVAVTATAPVPDQSFFLPPAVVASATPPRAVPPPPSRPASPASRPDGARSAR